MGGKYQVNDDRGKWGWTGLGDKSDHFSKFQ